MSWILGSSSSSSSWFFFFFFLMMMMMIIIIMTMMTMTTINKKTNSNNNNNIGMGMERMLFQFDLIPSAANSPHHHHYHHYHHHESSKVLKNDNHDQDQQDHQQHHQPDHQQHQDRRRLRNGDNDDDKNVLLYYPPKEWFHPKIRGIYATLHPPPRMSLSSLSSPSPYSANTTITNSTFEFDDNNNNNNNNDDSNDDNIDEYQHFVKYRHLSRYERHLRATTTTKTTTTKTKTTNLLSFDYSHNVNHTNHNNNNDTSLPTITNDHQSSTMMIRRKTTTTTTKRQRRRRNLSSNSNSNSKQQNQHRNSNNIGGGGGGGGGGQFNDYQGIPLSQGYGTHYIHIWVGSPIPQRQTVIVDTGSHYTAFPCQGCSNCGQQHHTDPEFQPYKSESFQYVVGCEQCANDCRINDNIDLTTTTSSQQNQQQASSLSSSSSSSSQQQQPELPYYYCPLTQAYTEGSSWNAIQAKDGLYCGGTDILEAADPIDRQFLIPFMFGCLTKSSGLFVTQLANGIMGLSAHETTLPKQLYDSGLLEYNMFALCFRRELRTSKRGVTAGTMTLGGSSSALDLTPMIYAKNIAGYGWFTVNVRNVYMMPNHMTMTTTTTTNNDNDNNGSGNSDNTPHYSSLLFDTKESIQNIHSIVTSNKATILEHINSGKGVIVDSGTTDTYLNPKLLPEFAKYWKHIVGSDYSDGPLYLTKKQLLKLPTLLIQCEAAASYYNYNTNANNNNAQQQRSQSQSQSLQTVIGEAGMLDPIHPKDVILAIPASNYMEYNAAFNVYTSRLYFTESSGGVIGANAMQGHNVVFDWQHGRIGFSHSTCDYDLVQYQKKRQQQQQQNPKSNNNKNVDGVGIAALPSFFGGGGGGGGGISVNSRGSDCVLEDTPILSKPCQVDSSVCYASDNPDNVSVLGIEIWTWIVDSNGRDIDSCHDVLTDWTLKQQIDMDPSKIDCTHNGICTEQRQCEIPCLQAMAMSSDKDKNNNNEKKMMTSNQGYSDHDQHQENQTDIIASKEEDGGIGEGENDGNIMDSKCGDSLWSSCDFGCEQSRIFSRANSNLDTLRTTRLPSEADYCIEVSRETRPCHVDACGRSDPCLVPFLVHVILVLEGSTQYDDDAFRKEFTRAAHLPEFTSNHDFFQEGDLDILVIRPWYHDDESEAPVDNFAADDGNVSKANATSAPEDDNPIGIQIILEISIFNTRAQAIEPAPETAHRSLLQEIGSLWTNISRPFRDPPPPLSTCDVSDIYPLARDSAELAYGILSNKNFGSELAKGMAAYHTARVVSSWTVSTQVVDDATKPVYPLSTMTPSIFIIRVCLETSLLITLVAAMSLLVQMVLHFYHWYRIVRPLRRKWWHLVSRRCRRRKGQYYYDPVKGDDDYNADDDANDDDDNSLNAKIMGTTPLSPASTSRRSIEVELPMVRSYSELDRQRSKTKATKRKNSNPISPRHGD